MLEKNYDHAAIEARIFEIWANSDAFQGGSTLKRDPKAKPFSIVIPPPNVTGSLHMGHAFVNTLQDVLARFERMRGRDVLWLPGTDHAGIATQSLVERQMLERKEPSRMQLLHEFGPVEARKRFLEKVWAWKEQSGGEIIRQLKRLGASCDWSRERFTMDEGLSRAVTKVFVDLHKAGLIYKDKRLVNWDPKLQTAVSDLEVETREVKGHMWHFAYPLKDGPVDGISEIVIATTRPETMLGDGAVAVHPSDARYKNLVGKLVRLPIAERYIPIITDEYPDPEFGSGAVKITGAHDFNDFNVARRHNIPLLPLMDGQARMASNVPERYVGLDRFEARKKVVAEIEEQGLLRQIEDRVIPQPFGERSGVVLEPFLTDQWYVDAKTMAEPALAAVRDGKTAFVPDNWKNTYYHWMENIQPWCISRQLWWGHQIPAWYGAPKTKSSKGGDISLNLEFDAIGANKVEKAKIFVASTELEARAAASKYYGVEVGIANDARDFLDRFGDTGEICIWRDPDVLDTWFSSALWPFSTMGWPDKTPDLKRYYPTTVLVTGFDIIFFWVARMMMMGMHFMKDVPFRDVFIHGLVVDEKDAKMSKSKGNVVDPLHVMGEYGADALRFTMAALGGPTRFIRLSTARIESSRNFATKLWNAARFAEMNGCARVDGFNPAKVDLTLNKWIYAETNTAVANVTTNLEAYRFNDAANEVYRFVRSVFCDWYLEFAKPVFLGDDAAEKAETQAMTAWALDQILKLLHPFMPFITEELWAETASQGAPRETLLCIASWPKHAKKTDAKAVAEVQWAIDLISDIRSIRSEMNVAAAAMIPLTLSGADRVTQARTRRYEAFIKRLARVDSISFADTPPAGSVQFVAGEATIALSLAGLVDFGAERDRLHKEIGKLDLDIEKIDVKLNNEQFTSKAPEDVIEENRARRAEAQSATEKLKHALLRLDLVK